MKKLDIINALREIASNEDNRKYYGFDVVTSFVYGLGNDNIRSASTISNEYKKEELEDALHYFNQTVEHHEAIEEPMYEMVEQEDITMEQAKQKTESTITPDYKISLNESFNHEFQLELKGKFSHSRIFHLNNHFYGTFEYDDYNDNFYITLVCNHPDFSSDIKGTFDELSDAINSLKYEMVSAVSTIGMKQRRFTTHA
jgi:hypothetical protein